MSLDTVTCEGAGTEYCLDYLCRSAISMRDVCGPCLARIIPALDVAGGRDLPWPVWLRERSGVPAPAVLEPIRDAGVAP